MYEPSSGGKGIRLNINRFNEKNATKARNESKPHFNDSPVIE